MRWRVNFKFNLFEKNQSKTKPKYKLRLRLTEFKITNANSHLFAPFKKKHNLNPVYCKLWLHVYKVHFLLNKQKNERERERAMTETETGRGPHVPPPLKINFRLLDFEVMWLLFSYNMKSIHKRIQSVYFWHEFIHFNFFSSDH